MALGFDATQTIRSRPDITAFRTRVDYEASAQSLYIVYSIYMGRGKRKDRRSMPSPVSLPSTQQLIIQAVATRLHLSLSKVREVVGSAKPEFGDLTINCHPLAHELGCDPSRLAIEIADVLKVLDGVASAMPTKVFVNVGLSTTPLLDDLFITACSGRNLLSGSEGRGKRLVIEFSSPNAARGLGFHHLRGTALGAALARLYKLRGYAVTKVNYLGDFGHNIGLLLWKLNQVGADGPVPPGRLQKLYVAANRDQKRDPAVKKEADRWLELLSSGDSLTLSRWQMVIESTKGALEKTYARLGITFDDWQGESSYVDSARSAVERLLASGVALRGEDGAVYVPGDEGKQPIVLITSAGNTTYESRDIAALLDRHEHYDYARSLYLTDIGQSGRFDSLIEATGSLDAAASSGAEHLGFGQMRLEGAKAKSREGKTLTLTKVLNEATSRSADILTEGEWTARDAKKLAEEVGIGAVLFSQLRMRREVDFDFDLGRAVSLKGATSPRIQYTYARIQAILAKADISAEQALVSGDTSLLAHSSEHAVALAVARLPEAATRALAADDTSYIADALLSLTDAWAHYQTAGKKDSSLRVLSDDPALRSARLRLAALVATAVKEGLAVLGIGAPERM